MRESFSGFKAPTVIASGRLHMAHGGAFAWMDAHPGFTAAITNAVAGVAVVELEHDLVTLQPSLTTFTAVVLGSSATASQLVSCTRTSATTITVRSMTAGGVATDGDISLIVLCV